MRGSHGYKVSSRPGTNMSGNPLVRRNVSRVTTETPDTTGKTYQSRDHNPLSSVYPCDPPFSPMLTTNRDLSVLLILVLKHLQVGDSSHRFRNNLSIRAQETP
jgi:hypothetical protein